MEAFGWAAVGAVVAFAISIIAVVTAKWRLERRLIIDGEFSHAGGRFLVLPEGAEPESNGSVLDSWRENTL